MADDCFMVDVRDLSDTEQMVWHAFPEGARVDLRTGDWEDDDPGRGAVWGEDRQVRAEVLLALLCGAVRVPSGQVGQVWLWGARIIGKIELQGGEFVHRMLLGQCHIADGINLTESVTRTLCLDQCYVGPILMQNTKINGTFELTGAHLDGGETRALNADGLTVSASMLCDQMQALGMVHLPRARIGGDFVLGLAELDANGDDYALAADGMTVGQSMICEPRFRAKGEIRLSRAHIGGSLLLAGATLSGDLPEGRRLIQARLAGQSGDVRDLALQANQLTVAEALVCDRGFRAEGGISLTSTTVGRLVDEKESWPERVELDGLTYRDIKYITAKDRLDWLNRSAEGYWPQPYEQLAAHYRRLGHDDQARLVLLARQRRRTRLRPWWARGWGWLQDGLAGYGYAPGRAITLLAVAFIVGWLVISGYPPSPRGPAPHASFNAALYVFDVMIPFAGLGQASDWDPHGPALAVAVALHAFGWLLAITVIAAITRTFSRS
jgi:hypothetical protein